MDPKRLTIADFQEHIATRYAEVDRAVAGPLEAPKSSAVSVNRG
jgi:hypothetical protein